MRLIQITMKSSPKIHTLDDYLKDTDYREYAKGLIKRGICFVAITKDRVLCFYPCRFLGYAQNTKDKHFKNSEKDGRVVKQIISKIIGHPPEPN